jgi:hypothetical protein
MIKPSPRARRGIVARDDGRGMTVPMKHDVCEAALHAAVFIAHTAGNAHSHTSHMSNMVVRFRTRRSRRH